MLLDESGAQSVNLVPNEVPSDIYQIVADKVKAKFKGMVDEPMAQQWLAWGFDRKATKRSVMILPYSGTLHSAKDYIREYVKDRDDKCPFEDEFAATSFFAKHVWAEIENTVPAAREAMKWLREVAKQVTKGGKTLNWRTPLHFMVEQDNRENDQFRVDLMIGRSTRFQPYINQESERLDKDAQMLGVSPNFVHSLDAACLMLTVDRALDEGIEDFAMVHDSYGVLAGKMETLYMGLRQAFVDIYQHDVMSDFLTATTEGLSEDVIGALREAMPKKGKFNLESVKESKYFFA
jgi:DNA-directed RNA polymerase